jgi:glycosyltransferase involved in cell wall biosynthesis
VQHDKSRPRPFRAWPDEAEPLLHIVVVIDHAKVNGGQVKVALDSAKGLARRGHRVALFSAVGPVDPSLAEAGVEVVCLGQPDVFAATSNVAFAAQAIWNRPAARALRELLAPLDRDDAIVHVHGWAKALSPSIGRAIARAGVAAVYTMHEYFLVCPNGSFYDHPAAAVCHRAPMSLACIGRNCDARRSYTRKILRVARHVALDHVSGMKQAVRHVITLSDMMGPMVRRHLPKSTVLHRVDNPVDLVDPGPKPAGPVSADFLFVGRLSAEKGVHLFLEAAQLLGVRAVVVGDGPARDELSARFPDAVMLGWKGPRVVAALMRAARALVFPSVWYEGQPLTVQEALAMGTPVIVSDVCAGREAVTHGVNGLWFRSNDVGSLAGAIERLGDDRTAARMASAAYAAYWAKPLTLDRHIDALTQVYADALAGG